MTRVRRSCPSKVAALALAMLLSPSPAAAQDCRSATPRDLRFGDGEQHAAVRPDLYPHILQEAENVRVILLEDFDGDGDADVLLGNFPGSVSLFGNAGDGRLDEPLLIDSAGGVVDAVAADFDLDGDLDVMLAAQDGIEPIFSVGHGLPRRSFGALVPSSSSTRDLAAGDFDGDGDTDIAVAIALEILMVENRGDRGFSIVGEIPIGSDPRAIASGDMDGDGRVDLVAANSIINLRTRDSFSVIRNLGDWSFAPPRSAAGAVQQKRLELADVDCDGDLDVVVVGFTIELALNDGAGGFEASRRIGAQSFHERFAFVDLDGGSPEIYFSRQGALEILGARRDGEFDISTFPLEGGLWADSAVGAGDLDGDGLPDLAFAAYEGSEIRLGVVFNRSQPEEVSEAFRRGDVNSDSGRDIADALGLLDFLFRRGARPACRKAADVNDDSRLDVADAVTLLVHLFQGGESLPPPGERCGEDPTPDTIDCEASPSCP